MRYFTNAITVKQLKFVLYKFSYFLFYHGHFFANSKKSTLVDMHRKRIYRRVLGHSRDGSEGWKLGSESTTGAWAQPRSCPVTTSHVRPAIGRDSGVLGTQSCTNKLSSPAELPWTMSNCSCFFYHFLMHKSPRQELLLSRTHVLVQYLAIDTGDRKPAPSPNFCSNRKVFRRQVGNHDD